MMSTYVSAPLSLPTASVPAFIALAGPEESAREGLSGEAQLGLDKVFEADGALSAQAQMLLAPIREDSTPLTQFALSPRYASSGVRRQCAFIAPGQSTILSSLKEPETTQMYRRSSQSFPLFLPSRIASMAPNACPSNSLMRQIPVMPWPRTTSSLKSCRNQRSGRLLLVWSGKRTGNTPCGQAGCEVLRAIMCTAVTLFSLFLGQPTW